MILKQATSEAVDLLNLQLPAARQALSSFSLTYDEKVKTSPLFLSVSSLNVLTDTFGKVIST